MLIGRVPPSVQLCRQKYPCQVLVRILTPLAAIISVAIKHEAIHLLQLVQSLSPSGLHIPGPRKPVLPSHVGCQAAYKWHGPEEWPAARCFGDGSSATVIGLRGLDHCRIVVAQPAVTQSNHHVPGTYPTHNLRVAAGHLALLRFRHFNEWLFSCCEFLYIPIGFVRYCLLIMLFVAGCGQFV